MTIEDFYKWAKCLNVTDAEIELQYQDGGGVYEGTCEMREISCKKDEAGNVVAVVLA